jgi:alkylhydroperoxidase family enzyme
LHRRYGDRAEFLAIYLREAHPIDGWREPGNDRIGISIKQPRDPKERHAVAQRCSGVLEISMPLLVDGLFDVVGHTYSGMPDRLYVIDRGGRVAYKSGRGPFGFKPRDMEQALILMLLDEARPPEHSQGRVPPPERRQGRVPVLDDADAWKRLSPAKQGVGRPLPTWARALAGSLPRTTGAMLELDYLHRIRSPLDPALRGKIRWVAAHANGCVYSEAYAAADLRRAGLNEAAIQTLTTDPEKLPAAERAALAFARKMTLAAHTVTDGEVAELRKFFGDRQVVAMVLLLAYANFQDRLLLTLDVPLEEGGPLKPLEVRFSTEAIAGQSAASPRQPPAQQPTTGSEGPPSDPEWSVLHFPRLQHAMESQRQRASRIPVPSWDEVRKNLPPTYPADKALRIRWSLVCLGYQPELAAAWSACTRAFGQEAHQDRVFEESLFWVVTRSLHCFY